MANPSQQAEVEAAEPDKPVEKEKQPEREETPDDPGCAMDGDDQLPCPVSDPDNDDKPVSDDLFELNCQLAGADAIKPVMMEQLACRQDPASQNAIIAAYEKALSDGLDADYRAADEQFLAIARELNRPVDEKDAPLKIWIDRWLGDPEKDIGLLFDQHRQVAARLLARSGPRECALRRAEAAAKQAKQAHEDWKTPGPKIKTILDSYKDKLSKLGRDAHSGEQAVSDNAIYQFWFDVAPKHLGLRTGTVRESNAPGVGRLCSALRAFRDRRRALASAGDRKDGGLYLINPSELGNHRRDLLESWGQGVVAQVNAEVAYKLRPDDAASLKARLATLTADEPATIKKLLQAAA